MKQLFLPLSFLFFTSTLFAQQSIDVTEQTFKVGGFKTEELYFGFAAGDEVIFNFSEAGNKEVKEIEIIEWPSSSRFSDYKSSRIENKTIKLSQQTILKFRFYNGGLSGRVCKIKIQRIPANENLRNFNTKVAWGEVQDTTYTTVKEEYLVSRAYVPKVITPITNYFVNSGSNAFFKGGKSRITFPITLPRNTVEWYYEFSAARNEEQIQKVTGNFNLVGQLSKLIDRTGGIEFGIDALTQPPGAD